MWVLSAYAHMPPNSRDERKETNKITNDNPIAKSVTVLEYPWGRHRKTILMHLRYKRQTILDRTEMPLREYIVERVNEEKNQCITETGEKRQTQHNRLLHEHSEWSDPDRHNLLSIKFRSKLTGPINMTILGRVDLTQLFRFVVDE